MSAPTSGRWPVVLSTRAWGEYRLLAQDKNTFDIVRKKLRELSYGQFTTNNYLPVRGSTHYIPIFRARLSNDLRIIYRIDLESDGYNQYDHQIIRVLTVSSRARVAYDFWLKVSKFLRRRGPEYRKRCIRRDMVNTKDGPLCVPSSFPHKTYNSLTDPDPELEGGDLWDESEMSELHEAVVLEKYIPVTKSLYNSILADMDTVLPIILNPDEKAIVRYQGTSVVIGRSGTGKTTALVYKMRANALAGSTRQLFVTRSPVLTRRVASYYKGLIESNEIASKSPEELWAMRQSNQKDQPRDILEFDNEADLRDDLPDRYSELTEVHFPLFISFDRLGQLLEADTLGTDDALTLARNKHKRLINFGTFKHHYWSKFDYNLTRKLDPALVFSEILGVIKGYGQDLTEEEYLNGLTTKKSPLLANVRIEVYAIFKAYRERCNTRGETDAADRVRAILSAQKDSINVGPRVEHLFVDEVQDQLMADVYLLYSLCSNINGGYWCGDTAQTINVGSSFRIRDMKAYIYEKMVPAEKTVPNGFQRKVAAPFSTFELTVNFRSHSGIVKYAASLVQLLYTLFPGSIDHMQPESAPIPGPKPLVFISPSWDEALFAKYLLDGRPADQCPPFGPEQAIIVRSEATAHSLRTRLQNQCNVLTLFESKGLEFDDLILYGFFAESDVPLSAWRKIATLESYEADGATRFSKPLNMSSISPGICSELKQLYVAVTRARHRCWIWDSGLTAEMMKDFWQSLGLIKVSNSMDSLSLFAETSDDPRQWARRAEVFFSNGLYAIAQTCFERAGREKEAQIADAYNHMSEAGKLREDSPLVKSAHITAAEKMLACTKLHSLHATATLWYHAATCFEAAKEISRASEAYSGGEFYDKAVLVLFEAQDMLGCLQVITLHSQRIDEALLRRIKEVVSVHFLRQQDYRRLKQLYGRDLGECIELARSLGFKAQVKDLLRITQRFEDLATEHLSDGLPAEAVSCLVHCVKSPSAIQQSRVMISVFLWTNFGLKDTPGGNASEQANLLFKLCNLQDDLLDREGVEDVKVFEAIASQKRITLDMFYSLLGGLNRESKAYCSRVAILQYHLLKGNRWVMSPSHEAFFAHLGIWSAYNTHFQQFKALKCPSQDAGIRRSLGLSNSSSTSTSEITIPNGSPLYKTIIKSYGSRSVGQIVRSGITVHFSHADMHIQSMFANQVKKELVALSSDLLGSHRTQLAPSFPNNIPGGSGTTFEGALKSIFLALSTLGSAVDREHNSGASVLTESDEEKIWIAWTMRLFSVVFSSSGSVGSLGKALPGAHSSKSDAAIMFGWVSKTLTSLDPPEHNHMFVTLLVVCVALIFELKSNGAPFATMPPLEIDKHARSSVLRGCPKEPDRFTDDIVTFFQRDSPWRIINMDKTLRRMIRNSWFIDISVLAQLIEQTTRGVILAERATVSWSYGGFSGLIAPRSWATNLVMHSNHAGHSHALNPRSLGEFVGYILEVLVVISNGIPEHWSVSVVRNGAHKCHLGVIAARLLWSMMIVMVNLHPDHESVRFVLGVLDQAIAQIINFQDSFAEGFRAIGFSVSRLPKKIDRQSCLPALLQTYFHEDVIMLQGRRASINPRASLFTGKIIKFDSLVHLRNILARCSQPCSEDPAVELSSEPANAVEFRKTESEPKETVTNSTPILPAEHDMFQLDESEVTHMTPPSRPDTPESISDSEGAILDDWDAQPDLSPEAAALRIFRAWTRSVKREEQRQRLSDFDQEGQLYEQYRQHFPRVGIKTPERDKLGLKLIRGPCINIVLALRLLAEEIDVYTEALKKDMHAPGLTPAQLASTQESIKQRKKKAEEYKDTVLTCCPLDSPPKLLIAKNLAGVKTQTKRAWDAFMLVKNAGILQKSERFREIEALMSSGRDAVLDATKPLQ